MPGEGAGMVSPFGKESPVRAVTVVCFGSVGCASQRGCPSCSSAATLASSVRDAVICAAVGAAALPAVAAAATVLLWRQQPPPQRPHPGSAAFGADVHGLCHS